MSRKVILLVDDEADLIHFLKANLELAGNYEVITVENGEDAVEAAVVRKPDLIFLDIVMPRMDGYEVLRRLKKDHIETKNIPVAMLTALKEKSHEAIAEGFGVVGYITKPFSMNDVLRVINQK